MALTEAPAETSDATIRETQPYRVLQASMLTGKLNTPLFEAMLVTHVAHGQRWGYQTRTLRRFIRGRGNWDESMFSKPLHIMQLFITEMEKPEEERAEWIV